MGHSTEYTLINIYNILYNIKIHNILLISVQIKNKSLDYFWHRQQHQHEQQQQHVNKK